MGRVYHVRIGLAAKSGNVIKLSTGLLNRMDSKAQVDELQSDGPDCLNVFELLRFGEIAFSKEVRERARVELYGQRLRRRGAFVDRGLGCIHGGLLSFGGDARPLSSGRVLNGLEILAVFIGEAPFRFRFQ